MIIDHHQDLDCGHLLKIDPSILFAWEWNMVRLKHQPERMDEVNGELFLSVSL